MNLPKRLAQWSSQVAAAAKAHAVPDALIFGVMDRESEGGEGPGMRELCGDWTARVGRWLKSERVRIVSVLPEGWHPPRDKQGAPLPGPYAIPEDGLGWGRGLMQVDFHNALTFDWRDPASNIAHGAWMLSVALAEFPKNQRAGIASYNCGAKNVRQALLDGRDVDFFTTGRNYSADVLRRRDSFFAAPETSSGSA